MPTRARARPKNLTNCLEGKLIQPIDQGGDRWGRMLSMIREWKSYPVVPSFATNIHAGFRSAFFASSPLDAKTPRTAPATTASVLPHVHPRHALLRVPEGIRPILLPPPLLPHARVQLVRSNHEQYHLHEEHEHPRHHPGDDASNVDVPLPPNAVAVEEAGEDAPREEVHEGPEAQGCHDHVQPHGRGVHHALHGDVVVLQRRGRLEVRREVAVRSLLRVEAQSLQPLPVGGVGVFGGGAELEGEGGATERRLQPFEQLRLFVRRRCGIVDQASQRGHARQREEGRVVGRPAPAYPARFFGRFDRGLQHGPGPLRAKRRRRRQGAPRLSRSLYRRRRRVSVILLVALLPPRLFLPSGRVGCRRLRKGERRVNHGAEVGGQVDASQFSHGARLCFA
mmetsp:Transcript_13624/g.29499  ORF Transcript_13624/g.29499 Transcript_13624/m.29499 type:complete len:395 (-) Transcript_13624:47-1231(-)